MLGQEVAIVSSVSANISGYGIVDRDQDAVLTRVIPTFTNPPEPLDPGSIVQQDSFVEHAIGNGIVFRGGHWVDRDGNRVRVGRGGPAGTGDTMVLGLWFAIMVITLICLILLRMTYGTGRRRKEIPAAAGMTEDTRMTGDEKGGDVR
jgi:hypothetical protein